MTICIAAIAESGKKLVVAVDRMITANYPMAYEFDNPDSPKILDLADNAVALISGATFYSSEVVRNAKKHCFDNRVSKVADIAEIARWQYQNYRRNLVSQFFLEPRGLNVQMFYDYQVKLNAGILQQLDFQLGNYNMSVELLVAGHSDGESRVFSVSHPGTLICHDSLGYACIGSGAPHAMYHLIGSKYKKADSVKSVESLVREAKKKAELAPGVGEETEVRVIDAQEAHHAE